MIKVEIILRSLLSAEDREQIRHVVAISCYKEPIELIPRSVDTLAAQSGVDRIPLIISFEERTPNVHDKSRTIAIGRESKRRSYSGHHRRDRPTSLFRKTI